MSTTIYKEDFKVIVVPPAKVVAIPNFKVLRTSGFRAVTSLEFAERAKDMLLLRIEVKANENSITTLSRNLDNEIESRTQTFNSLSNVVNDNKSEITSTKQLITSESQARATDIDQVKSTLRDEISSEVQTINETVATNKDTSATSITNLRSDMNDGDANIIDGLYGTSGAVTELRTFVGQSGGTGLKQDIEVLKKQNDGKVETFANTHDIILGDGDTGQFLNNAEPYSSWKSAESTESGKEQDVRHSHIGDVYIKYETQANGSKKYIASYKFIQAEIDTTSPYNTDPQGFTWAIIVDQVAQAAYEAALNAQSLADGKITSFYFHSRNSTGKGGGTDPIGTNKPTAESTGDIWFDPDDGNKIYMWNDFDWIDSSDKRIKSIAESVTNIDAYLKDSNGVIGGAESSVVQKIVTEADRVESKFEYGTKVKIDGKTYNSGFGLTTLATGGTGTNSNPFDSEFWINAEKFKFTNGIKSGQMSPFTIDASGANPKVAFNGKVTFDNVETATGVNALPSPYGIYGPDLKLDLNNYNWGGSAAIDVVNDGLSHVSNTQAGTFSSFIEFGKPPSYVTKVSGKMIISVYVTVLDINSPNTVNNIRLAINSSTTGFASDGFNVPIGVPTRISWIPNFDQNGETDVNIKIINETNSGTGNTTIIINKLMIESQVGTNTAPSAYVSPFGMENVIDVINNYSQTTINGPVLTAGSVTATQIAAKSVSADRLSPVSGNSTVWSGGGLVSDNFNGNAHGAIGSPTAGFRLSSDAAGSVDDPNVYGAYIKASTMEASTMLAANGTYTGDLVYSSTISGSTSGYLYGRTYGSGYISSRVVKPSSFCTIVATGDVYVPEDNFNNFALQMQLDSGSWVTVANNRYGSSGGEIWNQVVLTGTIGYSSIPASGTARFRIVKTSGQGSISNQRIAMVLYNF